jgi:hypothetical protein
VNHSAADHWPTVLALYYSQHYLNQAKPPMLDRDLIVAVIASMFGLASIWSGLANLPFAFQLWLPRLLEQRWGRSAARWALVLLGVCLLALGWLVQFGR